MRLERYYELLAVKEGDRILIEGVDSLLPALYVAGRARNEKLKISVHALINPTSSILSETDAVKYAKNNLEKLAKTVEDGTPFITFSVETLDTMKTKGNFNKATAQWESLDEFVRKLPRLEKAMVGEKLAVLDLPFEFFRRIKVIRKAFLGERKEEMSFREFLTACGFRIGLYDAFEARLNCALNLRKFEPPANLVLLDLNSFGAAIVNEILQFIIYMRTDLKFCIESDEKEYLYLVQGEKTKNQAIECRFIFLDGEGRWKGKEPVERSRSFTIIVLPNTPTFRKELDEKEFLISPKKRAFELYGEEIEPY